MWNQFEAVGGPLLTSRFNQSNWRSNWTPISLFMWRNSMLQFSKSKGLSTRRVANWWAFNWPPDWHIRPTVSYIKWLRLKCLHQRHIIVIRNLPRTPTCLKHHWHECHTASRLPSCPLGPQIVVHNADHNATNVTLSTRSPHWPLDDHDVLLSGHK